MQNLTVFPADLTKMSVAQVAALPRRQVLDIIRNLDEVTTWTKQIRAKVEAALEQCHGAEARAALRESGRDFGTVHLVDGDLRITFELPKKVTWDQKQLAAMAARIADSGDPVADYIDIKYTVSESRYKNWPATLQQQFASARTVEPGKPSFTLTLLDGGAE